MGFNSAFKGLKKKHFSFENPVFVTVYAKQPCTSWARLSPRVSIRIGAEKPPLMPLGGTHSTAHLVVKTD